jgi:hypothetical protein
MVVMMELAAVYTQNNGRDVSAVNSREIPHYFSSGRVHSRPGPPTVIRIIHVC